jgi:hypothetical protein
MRWYEYPLYLWCLPQVIVLIGVLIALKGVKFEKWYRGRMIFRFDRKASKLNAFFSGTALFHTILPLESGQKTIGHEHGHHIQGNEWGPLYLIVIGISSLRNNLKSRNCQRTRENYYRLHPEYRADILGNVIWLNGVRVYNGQ